MSGPSRRQFLEMSGAATLGLPFVGSAQAAAQAASTTVFMDQDGLGLTASETSTELARLCALREPKMDIYGLGGIVEEAEQYFARVLGKERALFMPTGTLANQLALRALAGEKRRVIVQDVSHVYNDTGDACQILSGQTLLPLAPERATFTWEEAERALNRTASGRVLASVGALSIESPVRRRSGELFDHGEMTRICAQAKQRGIGLHLDGARLFIASAYTGISPAAYAAPFDTVYVSLWKYFNSLNGAILAGPASLLDGMFHTRRMFGGALFSAWPFALLAQHYAGGFIERLSSAIAVSNEFMAAIKGKSARIERVANGTNIFKLIVAESKAEALMERLRPQQMVLAKPTRTAEGAVFNIYVNETWNRTTGARLAEQFKRALIPS
ncbi:MAG: threonine aldolase family protein [Burkholderiales bacterium]